MRRNLTHVRIPLTFGCFSKSSCLSWRCRQCHLMHPFGVMTVVPARLPLVHSTATSSNYHFEIRKAVSSRRCSNQSISLFSHPYNIREFAIRGLASNSIYTQICFESLVVYFREYCSVCQHYTACALHGPPQSASGCFTSDISRTLSSFPFYYSRTHAFQKKQWC
jgi:hypothetical protein